MRELLYRHNVILLDKVHKMFEARELTPAKMAFAGDILKDLSKMDASLSKACYYDSQRGASADKKY